MKLRKIAGVVASFTAAAAALSACGGAGQGAYNDADGKKVYTYDFNMYTQDNTEYAEGADTEFAKLIKEKFGIEFEYERIPRADWETKTNIAYSTGNEADLTTGGKEPQYKKWANQGYLEAIPEEYIYGDDAVLKDWKNLWSDEDFEKVMDLAKNSDGKLYYLPSVRQEKVQMCWDYRKDIFDKLNLEFPKTIDEFYEVCSKIKAAYPDKIIISSNGQGTASPGSALTGFCQAYWMPELIMTQHSYVDPVTNEFVPYALTTDNAREMYKTIKKFSDAGFIDKEIMKIDKDTFSSRLAQDNCFITYNYVYNNDDFTKKTKAGDSSKVAEWTWSDRMITAFPEKGTIYKRDPLYSNWGPAFSAGISEDEDRYKAVMGFFNWCATEEGQMFTTYGIEGESYDVVNGVPTFKEGWYDESNPSTDKKVDKTLTGEFGGIGAPFIKEETMFKKIRGEEIDLLWEAYQNQENYYYFDQIPMRYTEDEEKRYSDLETALNAKRDEYMQRFFSGDVDPGNDADWNQYLSDMKKVGLDEFTELQQTVYDRTKADIEAE